MSKDSLRVAIVGLGKMGILHASILNTLPNVQLTALCDKSAMIRKFCRRVFDGVHLATLIDVEESANNPLKLMMLIWAVR